MRDHLTVGKDFQHQLMGKRFTRFDIFDLEEKLRQRGYQCNLLAFYETPPFLQHDADHKGVDAPFLDGWTFIHNLSNDELNHLGTLIETCAADKLPLFWDPPPLIRATRNAILNPRSNAEKIANTQWLRKYVVDGTSYHYDARFDFSGGAAREALSNHLQILDREYHALIGILANAERTQTPLATRLISQVARRAKRLATICRLSIKKNQ
jgi:hypothetical protein